MQPYPGKRLSAANRADHKQLTNGVGQHDKETDFVVKMMKKTMM